MVEKYSFANALKNKREQLNISARQLIIIISDQYGVKLSASMLSRYERGVSTSIPFNVLWVLSDYLDIDLNKIAYYSAWQAKIGKNYDSRHFNDDYKIDN